MESIGLFACALIGLSLGLIGAGGSILTVPVLVFIFQIPPGLATSYSLFVVGVTSLFSAAGKYHKGEVLIGPALAFGLTSMVVVLGIRHYLIPKLPLSFGNIGNAIVSYDWLCMMLFAGLMISAAIFMLNKRESTRITSSPPTINLIQVIPYALIVGIVTGFLGAGGGFLIIPVMNLLLGIEIRKAVGTSLMVIGLNSLSGFVHDIGHVEINWSFLLLITVIAITGSLIGAFVAKTINTKHLKVCFSWFVLSLGIVIIATECYGFLTSI